MRSYVQLLIAIVSCLFLLSCKKDNAAEPKVPSVNNTSWQVDIKVTGNESDQNIFEFGGNGSSFSWHPAAADSYSGTWAQDGSKVIFTFREMAGGVEYTWDNTGTLSSDGGTMTGTMQRRGQQGSGSFRAKKL